jgi:hypothetical protein
MQRLKYDKTCKPKNKKIIKKNSVKYQWQYGFTPFLFLRYWLSCLGPLVFLLPETFNLFFDMNVHDKGYSRNALCALN